MILVSACLAGIYCRYNGGNNQVPVIVDLVEKGLAIPVCPEILGGLPTPREPVDIMQGTGCDVLAGRTKLLTESGKDVTTEFLLGADKVLQIALQHRVKFAVLKERSPSCGSSMIYNREPGYQEVRRKPVPGMGVTTALLAKNNITVFSEEQLTEKLLKEITG
ncbi:DUF523 domain-containing protein [Desulforamulus hydrothermalis]|uniref:Uncharacterized protein n=1 Tax=Desulforamulus hydrothermalis Lam5 = DSM 18033 TaxID=1121428 RepID=K8E7J6_9FIRM|nr:DUF523 domain-containing protein [Desulforamulus hydrothermalis]CCO07488.1 conserved hypothetical protein [Desulforamulus hydrothermalis Lam5 = DSM 18033]SHH17366.1 Uncharacterized conserved protein YbbK, DUF523 family [Desulforamulus hydrothermalis Lam5 = DSM 18033]